MKLSRTMLYIVSHVAAVLGGMMLGIVASRHLFESPVSATIAAAYAAENVRLQLEKGKPETWSVSVSDYLVLLEKLRPQLGELEYVAAKLQALTGLAVAEDNAGLKQQATDHLSEAQQLCTAAQLKNCSSEKLRELGLRVLRR